MSSTKQNPQKTSNTNNSLYRIRARLNDAFMFSALDDKELNIVIDAMEELSLEPNKHVIKQGEEGDYLYVVEEGTLECTKIFGGQGNPTYLKDYTAGEAFGELALLYNAPRAATIISKTDCTLWQLDRETFNYIVKDAAAKKREKYEDFLKSVPLLETIEPYERSKIADALVEEKYSKGEYVIKEGEVGNTFYFISEGQANATKKQSGGKPDKIVLDYSSGGYFGELALLKNEPRAASIIAAVSFCKLTSD
jgi:cAMP-dependent protein kinase regulator